MAATEPGTPAKCLSHRPRDEELPINHLGERTNALAPRWVTGDARRAGMAATEPGTPPERARIGNTGE